jgi:preprotein translocase subunit SecE
MATDKSVTTAKPKEERVRPQGPTPSGGAGRAGTAGRPGGSARLNRITKYLGEVRTELKKVTWPTKQELIAQTQVVVGLLIIIGVFMFLWDVILGQVFNLILRLLNVPTG